MSENEGNIQQQGSPNGPNNPQPEKQEVTFVISRHKAFFDMLENPRRSFRITILMAAFLIVLFLGLTLLTLTLKKNYPYSLIKSNEYGALLMQSEDIEIYNFMFNTAEIFVNSGVEVKKGDKLSIQATGRFHTAVQHLADTNIDAIWLGPDGDENPVDPRDKRLQEKDVDVLLAPGVTPECLLCFILDKDDEKCLENYVKAQSDFLNDRKIKRDGASSTNRDDCLNKLDSSVIMPHKTEKIGKAKEFNAWQDGKLFFVINDIIFTQRVNSIIQEKGFFIDSIDPKAKNEENRDTIKWSTTTTYKEDYNKRFIICPDAWYLDNVGSFLITIEKSQEK